MSVACEDMKYEIDSYVAKTIRVNRQAIEKLIAFWYVGQFYPAILVSFYSDRLSWAINGYISHVQNLPMVHWDRSMVGAEE